MRVDVPEYKTFIDFPDDTPPEQIRQVMSQNFPTKLAPSPIEKPSKSVGGFVSNVGSDVVDIGKGLYQMVRHPIDTASAIGGLVVGGSAAIQKKMGLLDENISFKGESAARQLAAPFVTAAQNPSGIPGQIADYAYDKPVSALMNLSGITGAAGKAAEVSGMARTAGMLTKASELTNPISLTAQAISKAAPVGKLIRQGAKETIGATTGAGPGAVEEAMQGSDAFKKAMRGQITGEEVVETAKNALNVVKDKRSADYKAKLAEVTDNKEPIDLTEIKSTITEKLKNFVKYTEVEAPTGYSKASKGINHEATPFPNGGGFSVKGPDGQYIKGQGGHPIFYQNIETANLAAEDMTKRAVDYAAREVANAGKQTQKNPMFNWSRTTVGDIKTSKDAKELKLIYDKIQKWGTQPGDNTAVELDRLRRDLDNHWSDSSRVRAFVADTRNTVNEAIKKSVPEYGEMTKGYAEATSLIKDIESGLMMRKQGMTGRVTADQTLRRLSSSMRENFEMRRDLVNVLGEQSGQDIAGQVAGYTMSSAIPRGLIGKVAAGSVGYIAYLNPKFWPLLAASSPRVMGEFLNVYGAGLRQAGKITGPLKGVGKAVQNPAITNTAFQIQQFGRQNE